MRSELPVAYINNVARPTALTSSTKPPTAEQFIFFTQFVDKYQDLLSVIISFLSGTTLCHFLSTCHRSQSYYYLWLLAKNSSLNSEFLSLVPDEFLSANQVFDTVEKRNGFIAKLVFNNYPNHRLPEYMRKGPDVGHIYTQHFESIINSPRDKQLVCNQLADAKRSVWEIRRWFQLKNQLIKIRETRTLSKYKKELSQIIFWLEEQLMKDPKESEVEPDLAKCIFDGDLSLQEITKRRRGGSTDCAISADEFKKFQRFVKDPVVAAAFANNKVNITELFQIGWSANKGANFIEICGNQHFGPALINEDVTHSELTKLIHYDDWDSFRNNVICAHLDSGNLRPRQWVDLVQTYCWETTSSTSSTHYYAYSNLLAIFNIESIQHLFISEDASFNELINLHRVLPWDEVAAVLAGLKEFLKMATIQERLNNRELTLSYVIDLAKRRELSIYLENTA